MSRPVKTAADSAAAPELSGSLLKGFALLELLADSEAALGVTEIARRLAMPKSGVHRLLQVMRGAGWVRQTAHGEYECSLKLWELGQRLADRIDLRRLAAPMMRELAAQTQESVHLSILDGTQVLYLDKLDSPQAIRAFTRIGGRAPAYCVATGRALLAYCDEATIAAAAQTMESFTPLTITTRAQLDKELEQVRRKGYAINRGEWRGGVRGLAAAIFDARGQAVAALGIAGPGERLTDSVMRSAAPLVVDAAERVSRELGYVPEPQARASSRR